MIVLAISVISVSSYCLLSKNQECKVRKVIVDNDYITFPYKIKVDKCVGSCNDIENPYFKVCMPDVVKNISVKSFDLISRKSVLRSILYHQSCKYGCLLDKKVCNNKQKWNKEKCRCECLIKENCPDNSSFNVVNCNCKGTRTHNHLVRKRTLNHSFKHIFRYGACFEQDVP